MTLVRLGRQTSEGFHEKTQSYNILIGMSRKRVKAIWIYFEKEGTQILNDKRSPRDIIIWYGQK